MASFRFGGLRIEGRSRAGSQTWLKVSPPGIAFDVGRGSERLSGVQKFFLSHAHLDHALGLPFVLSHRGWNNSGQADIYCPPGVGSQLDAFLTSAAEIEGSELGYQLVEVQPGDSVEVSPKFSVRAFATDHVVPSLGYHLIEHRKSLRPDLVGLDAAEVAAVRSRGESVTQVRELNVFTYTGDMSGTTLELEPELLGSQVLAMECTFLGDDTRQKAERYKHIHIEDLAANQHRFENEKILLLHLSRRHSYQQLREQVSRRLPELASRVVLFPFDLARTESEGCS